MKVKFHSNPYYNIIPKEVDGSGDFSVSLAMKFECLNAISYAQYFAIIPEKPTVGICMNGPAENADFTSITCEDWKDESTYFAPRHPLAAVQMVINMLKL